MIKGYENFYDWLIQTREANIRVLPWLEGFTKWVDHRDYATLVASHPGYLIKLTLEHFYSISEECWITAWANDNIHKHEDGSDAFAVVPVSDFGLVQMILAWGIIADDRDRAAAHYPEIRRVLFDREEDAALFKLTFMDKITPNIHQVNYKVKY